MLGALDAFARQPHPVFELVDLEAHPHAVQAVAGAKQLRALAKTALQFERDQPRDGPVGQRFNRLVGRIRVDFDAFLLG